MEEETKAEAEAACQTAGEEPREAVGYGRPPVASRFQLGQSGNPNGRPKGSQNKATLARPLNELVLQVARRGIALADDPDAPPVETIEMVLQALTNEAPKGSLPAQKFLLEKYEVAVADEKAQANASSSRRLDIANMHPDDREMLKGILERSRQYANE
jgi:hypothetical protein